MARRIPNTFSEIEVRKYLQQLNKDTENVTPSSVIDWNAAFAHKTVEDALNGLVKVDGAGGYSAITDNHAHWDEAYNRELSVDAQLKCLTSNI